MSLASKDTRERAIEAWKSGQPIEQICKIVGITRKTFYNWRKRAAEGCEQIPLPKGRPPRTLNEAHMARIKELCEANNSIYAREIRAELGLKCDLGVIYRALAELGLTFKKKR